MNFLTLEISTIQQIELTFQNTEAVRLGVMNGNVKYKGARIRVGDVITNVALTLNIFPKEDGAIPKSERNGLRKEVKLAKSNFEIRL